MPGPVDLMLVDNDLPHTLRLVSGPDLIVQRVQRRLLRYLGEYFLDTSAGLPYVEWGQRKPPPLNEIAAKLRREIEGVPGVVRVTALDATYSVETETVTVNGDADIEGDSIGITVTPFAYRGGAVVLRPSATITLSRRGGLVRPSTLSLAAPSLASATRL